MALTTRGLSWLAQVLAGNLEGAKIGVGDGADNSAVTDVSSVVAENGVVTLAGVFGEQEANFNWAIRWVELDGIDIDRIEEDQGRKAPGSVWSVEVTIAPEK